MQSINQLLTQKSIDCHKSINCHLLYSASLWS